MSRLTLLSVSLAIIFFVGGIFYTPFMVGGSLFLLAGVGIQGYTHKRLFPRTKLDLPLGLFLLSSLIGLWASHDFLLSLKKFGLILGSIGLYYALIQVSTRKRIIFAYALVFGAAILAIFYTLQHGILLKAIENLYPPLGATQVYIEQVSETLNLHQNYHNEIAGVLEIALLIGLGLLVMTFSQTSRWIIDQVIPWRPATILISSLVLISIGLILTGSRGSFMALLVVGLGWFLSKKMGVRKTALRAPDIIAVLIITGSVFWLISSWFRDMSQLSSWAWLDSDLVRLKLYLGSFQLIQDYIFTGAGLSSFPMLYSAYVLGWDVVFLYHPHNLYLSVWLEQGLLGLGALLWLGIAFLRSYLNRPKIQSPEETAYSALTTASAWAVIVFFLHGLVDSPHYNSFFLPVIFIPLGLSRFLKRPTHSIKYQRFHANVLKPAYLLVAALILVSGLVMGRNFILSSLYTNLGAVRQAKIELNDYRWPDRIPSLIRSQADLTQPISLFEQALSLNPHNSSAKRRLDLINMNVDTFTNNTNNTNNTNRSTEGD